MKKLFAVITFLLCTAIVKAQPLSGDYTIDATQLNTGTNFSSLTNAFNALKLNGISSSVTFKIKAGTYNEKLALGKFAGMGAGRTVRFEAFDNTLGSVKIAYAPTTFIYYNLIKLDSVENFTFSKIQFLTATNVYTQTNTVGLYFNLCKNITVENCDVKDTYNAQPVNYKATGIQLFRTKNVSISNTNFAALVNGINTNTDSSLVISNNSFLNTSTAAITLNSVYNTTVSSNKIDYCYNSGIEVTVSTDWGSLLISKNKITKNTISNTSKVNGTAININSYINAVSTPLIISNNYLTSGVNINNTSSNISVLHNTFYINQFYAVRASVYSNPNIIVKNNLFQEDPVKYTGTNAISYLVTSYNIFNAVTAANNNAFVSNAADTLTAYDGLRKVDNTLTLEKINFEINNQPNHFQSCNLSVNKLTEVPDDMYATTRNTTTTKGAVQVNAVANDAELTPTSKNIVGVENSNQNISVNVKNAGTQTISSITLQYRVGNQTPVLQTFATSIGLCASTTLTFSTPMVLPAGETKTIVTVVDVNGSTDGVAINDTASINYYTGLSGTYTINPTGSGNRNYIGFVEANNALRLRGIVAPVVFNMSNNTFVGDSITKIAGSSPINTITFQSAVGDSSLVIVNGIRFANATNIIVKGITVKDKIFAANFLFDRGENKNIVVQNCYSELTPASWGYQTTYSHVYTPSGFLDSAITFKNNYFKGGSYGAYMYGGYNYAISSTTPQFIKEVKFLNNKFYGMPTGLELITLKGGTVVEGNTFENNSVTGVALNANTIISYQDSFKIVKNKFINFTGSGPAYYGNGAYYNFEAIGVKVDGFATAKGLIANNFISCPNGGYALLSTYANVDVVNNNIMASRADCYSVSTNSSSFKNNVIKVKLATYNNEEIWKAPTTATANYDYNSYYICDANNKEYSVARTKFNAYISREPNAVFADPRYYTDTNLHVKQLALMGTGTPVNNLITDDIDGETRSNTFPDRGADEFDLPNTEAELVKIVYPTADTSVPSGVQPVKINIKNNGAASLTTAVINWTVNGVQQTPFNFSGNIKWDSTTAIPVNIGSYNFAVGTIYNIKAWITQPNNLTDPINTNDTAEAKSIYASLSGTYTLGGTNPDFTSFTHFANTINKAGVSGAVTINVRDGVYTDTLKLGKIRGVSSINNVTIQSENLDSSKVKLAYTYADYYDKNWLVKLDSTDNFTFNKISLSLKTTYNSTSYSNDLKVFSITPNTDSLIITNCEINAPKAFAIKSTDAYASGSYKYLYLKNNKIKNVKSIIELAGSQMYDYTTYTYKLVGPKFFNISNNIIDSMGAGFTYAYSNYYISLSYCDSIYITNNQFNENLVMGTSASAIYISNANNAKIIISNNKFKGVSVANAISLYYVTGTANNKIEIYNNEIVGKSTSSYQGMMGIYLVSSSYANIYHNTIINDGAGNSYNLYLSNCTNVDVKNNVLVQRKNSTPNVYVGYLSSTPYTAASLKNNIYFTKGTNQIFTNTGLTLANWLSTYKQDTGSIALTKEPLFVNNFTAKPLRTNIVFDGNALPLANVATDIDGNARNATTPDCGAYEYTPLANEVGLLSVSSPQIPFAAGIYPVSVKLVNGGKANLTAAVINWKVNGITQTAYNYTGNLVTGDSATVTLGNYNFSNFNGDSLQVIVSMPNGVLDSITVNDTVGAMFYPALSGVYTIGGTNPDFSTIKASFSALNKGGVAGAVTFNIRDGLYTVNDTLFRALGNSATNTITYQSESLDTGKVSLVNDCSYNGYSKYLLSINNVNFINFNKLKFVLNHTVTGYTPCSAGYSGMLNINPNATSFANYGSINISNSLFSMQAPKPYATSNYMAVSIDGNFFGQLIFNNNKLDSCLMSSNSGSVQASNNIVKSGGLSLFAFNSQLIQNNNIDSGYIKIQCQSPNTTDSVIIKNNSINKGNVINDYNIAAINVMGYNKANIYNNKISNSYTHGITVSGGNTSPASTSAINIYSNFVHLTNTSAAMQGIAVSAYTAKQNVYFNTVSEQTGVASSVAFSFANQATNIDVRNNSFHSKTGYAMYYNGSTLKTVDSINYNNYYTGGTNLAYYNYSNITTLAALKTATANRNKNAISIIPTYTSASDLHTNNPDLFGAGVAIPNFTTDIDGETRATKPCIGADEYFTYGNGVTNVVRLIDIPSHKPDSAITANTSSAVKIRFKNMSNTTLTAAKFGFSVNGTVMASNYSWTGSLASGDTSTPITIGTINFKADSAYNIVAYSVTANDAVPQDDTAKVFDKYAALSGTYTIGGLTPDYKTLQASLRGLEKGGIAGNVIFNIRDGYYVDSLTFGAYPNNHKYTVKYTSESGDSSKVKIMSYPRYTVPSYYGYYSTNTNNDRFVVFKAAKNITLSKLSFIDSMPLPSSSYYALPKYGQEAAIYLTNSNKRITIENCYIQGTQYGISNSKGYAVAPDSNITILNNRINKTNNPIFFDGEYCPGYCNNFTNIDSLLIQNNVITNTEADVAIDISNGNQSKILGNVVDAAISVSITSYPVIEGNKVIVKSRQNTNYGLFGILVNAYRSATVANNFVLVDGLGKLVNGNTITASGINITSTKGANVYHNTIITKNADTATFALSLSTSNYIYGDTCNNILFNNNIVAYNGTRALKVNSNAKVFKANNNNYYTPDGKFNDQYQNFIEWRNTNINLDSNSLNVNPIFISSESYKPISVELNNKGKYMATYPLDIDGNSRNASTPDIGCAEFSSMANDASIVRITSPTEFFPVGVNSIKVKLRNTGTSSLTQATLHYSINGVEKPSFNFTGNIASNDSAEVTVATYNFPFNSANSLKVWVDTVNNSKDVINAADTVARANCWAALNGTHLVKTTGVADFSSVTQLVNQLIKGGVYSTSTVNIASGNYFDYIYFTEQVKGLSPTVRLTLKSAANNADSVKINTGGYGYVQGLPYTTIQHITFNNFNSYGTPHILSLGNNIKCFTVDNCVFDNYVRPAQSTPFDFNNVGYNEPNVLPYSLGLYNYSGVGSSSLKDSVTITNCTFKGGGLGISGYGELNRSVGAKGLLIENNKFINNRMAAIRLSNFDSAVIKNNYIKTDSAAIPNFNAISLITPGKPFSINNNKIYVKGDGLGIEIDNSDYYQTSGISYNGNYGSMLVYNNFVKIGDSSSYTRALVLKAWGGISVLHNSLYNTSNQQGSAAMEAIFKANATTYNTGNGSKVINNILQSTNGYAVKYSTYLGNDFYNNYNNLFTGGTNLVQHIKVNTSGFYYNSSDTTNYSTLAAYKTAKTTEGSSISFDAKYVSNNNLHTQSGNINARALVLTEPYLAKDIDGDTRDNSTPDIGADEFTTPNMGVASIANVGSTCSGNAAQQVKVWVKNYATMANSFTPIQYQFNGGALVTDTITTNVLAGDSLLYTFAQTVDMSAVGTYTLRAWTSLLNDSIIANDSSAIKYLYTTPFITSFPYRQGFESGNGNWYAEGTNSSWQYGVPAATFIKNAANGTKAWVTNLTGPHNNNELSYLYTPCFNLSSITKNYVYVAFNMAQKIEKINDAAWLEMSSDGNTWTKVQAGSQAGNWYNNATANTWDGDTAGWKGAVTQIPLSSILDINKVQFRFVFKSNATIKEDGLGIDDFMVADTLPTFSGGIIQGARVAAWGTSNWVTATVGGNKIIEINDNGNNLGDLLVDVSAPSNVPAGTYNGEALLSRSWVIKPTNLPTTPVKVRLFFTKAEFDSLKAKDQTITSVTDLHITKYTGANEDFNLTNNTNGLNVVFPKEFLTFTPYNDGWYVEFETKTFSEYYISKAMLTEVYSNNSIVLKTYNTNQQQVLQWTTTSNRTIVKYEVEASDNGTSFSTTATVVNNLSNTYTHYISANNKYYRIKAVMANGEVLYSNVVVVNSSYSMPVVQAMPNPFVNEVKVKYNASQANNITLTVTNNAGVKIFTHTYGNTVIGLNNFTINAVAWAKGIYRITITQGTNNHVISVIKQ